MNRKLWCPVLKSKLDNEQEHIRTRALFISASARVYRRAHAPRCDDVSHPMHSPDQHEWLRPKETLACARDHDAPGSQCCDPPHQKASDPPRYLVPHAYDDRASYVGELKKVFVANVDGYHAVFALPELDHAFTDRTIILADRRDGKALAEKKRPPRIVVPDEKREARWVRQVIALMIRRTE